MNESKKKRNEVEVAGVCGVKSKFFVKMYAAQTPYTKINSKWI